MRRFCRVFRYVTKLTSRSWTMWNPGIYMLTSRGYIDGIHVTIYSAPQGAVTRWPCAIDHPFTDLEQIQQHFEGPWSQGVKVGRLFHSQFGPLITSCIMNKLCTSNKNANLNQTWWYVKQNKTSESLIKVTLDTLFIAHCSNLEMRRFHVFPVGMGTRKNPRFSTRNGWLVPMVAIENGHRNSGFTHWTSCMISGWWFRTELCKNTIFNG